MKKLVFVILSLLFILSCGSGSKSEGHKSISINLKAEGGTLDSTLATTEYALNVTTIIQEGLYKFNKDGELILGQAEKISKSEDGLKYTVTLRDDIFWSNGQKVTSNDFKYSWQRGVDPKVAAPYSYMLYPIKNAEKINGGQLSLDDLGVNIIDDRTFEIELEINTPYFDSLLAFMTYFPQNKEFVEKVKDNYYLEKEYIISNGPYKIKSWIQGEKMVFEKNPDYYNKDEIYFDEITGFFISDQTALVNAYKNDEVVFADITAEQFKEFEKSGNYQKVKSSIITYLALNNNKSYLSNKNIRQAINYAINKEELVDIISQGLTLSASYANTPQGIGMKGVKKDFVDELFDSGFKPIKYNEEKAKELLAKGLKELNLTELPTLTLVLNDGGSNRKIGEVLQYQLKQIGIDVNVEVLTYKERVARSRTNNFDMLLALWGADFLDPINYLDLLESRSGNNVAKFNNKQYDELIDKINKETNTEKRVNYMIEAEKLLADETPEIFLVQANKIWVINPEYKGIKFLNFGPSILVNYAYQD